MTTTIQDIRNHLSSIANPALSLLCKLELDNSHFQTAPAANKHHHAYPGGLAAHTLEVMEHCARAHHTMPVASKPNLDVMLTAAFWHDYMKIREYSGNPADENFRQRIGHIYASAAAFQQQATLAGIDWSIIDAVVHCILAHHGRPEWGSPVEPQTLEAMLLHHADMWSSWYGPTKDGPADEPGGAEPMRQCPMCSTVKPICEFTIHGTCALCEALIPNEAAIDPITTVVLKIGDDLLAGDEFSEDHKTWTAIPASLVGCKVPSAYNDVVAWRRTVPVQTPHN